MFLYYNRIPLQAVKRGRVWERERAYMRIWMDCHTIDHWWCCWTGLWNYWDPLLSCRTGRPCDQQQQQQHSTRSFSYSRLSLFVNIFFSLKNLRPLSRSIWGALVATLNALRLVDVALLQFVVGCLLDTLVNGGWHRDVFKGERKIDSIHWE